MFGSTCGLERTTDMDVCQMLDSAFVFATVRSHLAGQQCPLYF